MRIVSACLVGINCLYNGKNKCHEKIRKMFENGDLIPVCPEQMGGLPTPRTPQGILNGTGIDVIEGNHKVINKKGEDVTKQFLKGANEILNIAKSLGIKEAILKKTSPACGVGKTWQMSKNNGKLKNTLVDGDGVLTALLKRNNIKILTEEEIK